MNSRALAAATIVLVVAVALSLLRDMRAFDAVQEAMRRLMAPNVRTGAGAGGTGAGEAGENSAARCGISHVDPRVTALMETIHGAATAAAASHNFVADSTCFAITSSKVAHTQNPDGTGAVVVEPATVIVSNGSVIDVIPGKNAIDRSRYDGSSVAVTHTLDFGSLVVMPGFVDAHVHVNEPGVGEKEGWVTATRAAAAGGVTTVVDMPLNGPFSTIDGDSYRTKLLSAEGKTFVDVAYWGGFVTDNTLDAKAVDEKLKPLLRSGIAGVKAFLNKANEAFNFVGREHIENGLSAMMEAQMPLIVHAEIDLETDELPDIVRTGDPTDFKTFAAAYPREVRMIESTTRSHTRVRNAGDGAYLSSAKTHASSSDRYPLDHRTQPGVALAPTWLHQTEQRAIKLLLDVWKKGGARSRLHIAHLADSESLPMIMEAKRAGMNVTVETCPQYLYFSDDDIPKRSTVHKCKVRVAHSLYRFFLMRQRLNFALELALPSRFLMVTDTCTSPPFCYT